jgi:hypothetical protein
MARRLEAKITLKYENQKTAEAIFKALTPDNLAAPSDVQVSTIRKGNKVITNVKVEGKFATFTATIDDLLFSAATAEKALRTLSKTEE